MPQKRKRKRYSAFIAKVQGNASQFYYLPQTLHLIWNASHYWTVAWVVLLIIQGALPAATVYLTRLVVDSLLASVGTGISWESIQTLLFPVGLMAGTLLLTELLAGLNQWVQTAQSELVQEHISGLIHAQSVAIDYACYESSEYSDRLERARDSASDSPLSLLENMGSVLQNSITLFAMAAILLPYGIELTLVLILSALPAFYVTFRANLLRYQWSLRTTTDWRRLYYYEMLLTNSTSAAEIRLFNLGTYFQTAYRSVRRRLRLEQMQLLKDQSVGRLVAGAIALLISGIALAWMGYQVLLGLITLGDLALFYQAFNRGQGIIKALLQNLGQLYRNSLFVSNLFEFLQLQPQVIDPPHPYPVPLPFKQGICFQNVTFRYPGSDLPVLQNFNLTIPAGKIVAIVGDNGAGKSTLIKLLCRFYDPAAGRIELDGVDLRDFSVAELRQAITVLFQSPVPYYVKVSQNISFGDISATLSHADIEAAGREAGIHEKLKRLPQGYDSQLGKAFPNGTDLSGGEWQRLALARSFLRKAQLIILDEPTSAMDPWTEQDWLARFRVMATGRTAVVITHRFTLARQADIIHVMRAGEIVESGSHEDLLKQNGLYAESWRSQNSHSST